ncbi:MAG: right-handed parallel beta-helix repeat-containing protein [Candidatus Thiodiazotropha sp. 'RUGA']|nr:right-handed parallel beta-helix repeat-containing protein [Candidatus Thiodiazotropha sp. 'RUGA']
MNKHLLFTLLIATSYSTQVLGSALVVFDERSLQDAFQQASYNLDIDEIIFKRNSHISLSAPAIYSGEQPITLTGKGSTIDGSSAGSFALNSNLSAMTKDGTLIFNTAGEVKIKNLKVANSATRGIVVNVPVDASDSNISVTLDRVTVTHSALYGLHIDDKADAFDNGTTGSDLGVYLKLTHCTFKYNGTGAIDFDGIRIDERSLGDIHAFISNTTIDNNGGDGIELDEAGDGNVEVYMNRVSLNDNGFYNEEDLDDGFDIDEADAGNIEAILSNLVVNNNKDEGLDFDEAGDGNIEAKFKRISAFNNNDEAIKLDEKDAGNIEVNLKSVDVEESGDDGIQLKEIGEGKIETDLKSVRAINNKKYGIKIEQWVMEGEAEHTEEAGSMTLKRVELAGNGKGDEIKTNNIEQN